MRTLRLRLCAFMVAALLDAARIYFVSGYGDFTMVHRGILFAPVFFLPRVHLRQALASGPFDYKNG